MYESPMYPPPQYLSPEAYYSAPSSNEYDQGEIMYGRGAKPEVLVDDGGQGVSMAQPLLQQRASRSGGARTSSPKLPTQKDEEKMPLFLIKLWNIVEDPSYQQIIRWDDSGYSFHIIDPYSFCRNVLPHYFKHNNLNSLIRQLNMYGFRKMTPLDRGGLTRSESDQDHLEFSHPYFVRDHPELLVNIKRKASSRGGGTSAPANGGDAGFSSSSAVQQNLGMVMDELKAMKEKQRTMDVKMQGLIKENESLWDHLSRVQSEHNKQRQVVNKLVQFLVALVQPGGKRIPKRAGLLALDDVPPNKRARGANSGVAGSSSTTALHEVLDRLQREIAEGGSLRNDVRTELRQPNGRGGPIIADVTEEDVDEVGEPMMHGHSMGMNKGGMGMMGGEPKMSASMQDDKPHTFQVRHGQGAYRPPVAPQQQQQFEQPPVNRGMAPGTAPVPQMMHDQPSSSTGNHIEQIYNNPTITLSPSLDRQISTELQEYLAGMDQGIDNCRDLLGGHTGWDFDFPMEELEEGSQLALEGAPRMPEDRDFTQTPELLTPSTSPHPAAL